MIIDVTFQASVDLVMARKRKLRPTETHKTDI